MNMPLSEASQQDSPEERNNLLNAYNLSNDDKSVSFILSEGHFCHRFENQDRESLSGGG
jgi:hypothetical protein